MRIKWQRSALVAATITAGMAAGCAQDIGDIDRTSPNKVLKADLTDGVWWMNQKVVDSASTANGISAPSEGSMAETDKIRFVVEENYLLAYRAYPILPGSDDTMLNINGTNNYEELYDDNYKGTIRAMFPIESHFDVQREYDSSTGEQSNVITENTSDRNWYDRAYMRVKWDQNPIMDPWWLYEGVSLEIGYNGTESHDDPELQPYFERDSNGLLVYFDAPATYIVKPTLYDFYVFALNWGFADPYAATTDRIVTSFARDLNGVTTDGDTIKNGNYEPLPYDNYDMNRFGFFRIEQHTFDPQTGQIMDDGQIQLANRHDIWENNYTVDEDGNKVALPIELRTVKTTPFYIHGMPEETNMADMSVQIIDEWNVAFKRAVYLMKNPTNPEIANVKVPTVNALGESDGGFEPSLRKVNLLTEIDYPILKAALADEKDVFVACHIPVRETDSEACVPDYLVKQGVERVGYTPREGDFRKNYLWIVNQNLENGLLGYGPTADDPLTSQSISSQAHVYTAPMNYYATRFIDHMKYLNGELTGEGIRENDLNIARAKASRDRFAELNKIPSEKLNAKLNAKLLNQDKKAHKLQREMLLAKKPIFDYAKADRGLKALTATGALSTSLDNAIESYVLKTAGAKSLDELKDMPSDLLGSVLSHKDNAYIREMKKTMSQKGYCFGSSADGMFSDAESLFWAKKYEGRYDYDNIHKEIRAQVLRATALHEMGHTFGLRHNFAGSSDSMNYFNQYWDARTEQVFKKQDVETLSDLYSIWNVTDDQIASGMHVAQYSSIMDYYEDNYHGLGRYDHAAILYAYSGGTSLVRDENRKPIANAADCAAKGGEYKTIVVPVDGQEAKTAVCMKFQKGLVEYFALDSTNGAVADRSAIGEFPYDVLTHKDTTGISTFDDPIAVGQPYLELVHYRDFFARANSDFSFRNNRALVRMDDYLAQKTGSNRMVRVPYVFCTDDNHGKMSSCYTFDSGADNFERALYYINSYNNNYWFNNFRRGRAFWDGFSYSYGNIRKFLKLSDLFQHTYISNSTTLSDVVGDGYDLNYQVGQMSSDASFNFLASVVATPDYGIFCKNKGAGSMVGLSTADEARADVSEFKEVHYCGTDPTYYYVLQGEGRNRYYRYDVNAGFDYSKYEYEAPHVYTSVAAIIALFDNEADVIADTGDMNTYLYGFYNAYQKELTKLMDAAYAEDYFTHSPLLVRDGESTTFNGDEYKTGTLRYPALATTKIYLGDDSFEINALTGESVTAFNKLAASVPAWGKCEKDADCVASDNAYAVICSTLYNSQDANRCISLFDAQTATAADCPTGTVLAAVNTSGTVAACVLNVTSAPTAEQMDAVAAQPCSSKNREGYCAGNTHCANVNGTYQCVDTALRVETNTSLTQKFYMTLYGMLLTGMYGSDSTFYDQFNVYRVGSGETATPSSGHKTVTFEDPTTGNVYAANEPDCDDSDSAWCYSNNQLVEEYGGVKVIKRAQAAKELVEAKWNRYLELNDKVTDADVDGNTELYQELKEVYYDWYFAKWDLDSAIYDVNFLRSAYSVLGTLF